MNSSSKSDSLKLSQTSNNGSRYLQINSASIDLQVLLREGLTVEASLRADAQDNRLRIARLTRQADLLEDAARQLEGQGAKSEELRLNASTVADALERYLIAANTSVHWVTAPGKYAVWGASSVDWPKEPKISVMVQEGPSEGTLVQVMHQLSARDPAAVQRLLTVKFLRKGKLAFEDASALHGFFESMDVQKLLVEQSSLWPKAA